MTRNKKSHSLKWPSTVFLLLYSSDFTVNVDCPAMAVPTAPVIISAVVSPGDIGAPDSNTPPDKLAKNMPTFRTFLQNFGVGCFTRSFIVMIFNLTIKVQIF